MTAARRQPSLPPVHRLTLPAGPVDGTGARGEMQGKIKGRGTRPLGNPVCTWVWRGTRQGVAACREGAQCRIDTRKATCFALPAAPGLEGAAR